MKNLILASALILFSSHLVLAAELATVFGTPSKSLDFTRRVITERIQLGNYPKEDSSSTWAYSILARKGVQSAVSVEVLIDEAVTNRSTFLKGLETAATRADVVLTTIGPLDNDLCGVLSKHSEVAFVVVAGNAGLRLDPASYPLCLAGNILVVTALNQKTGELLPFANWGPLVKVAAPSKMISVTGLDGRVIALTNTTAGASLVAGKLAVYARTHETLKGSNLVTQFLAENTQSLPKLGNTVDHGLALIDSDL